MGWGGGGQEKVSNVFKWRGESKIRTQKMNVSEVHVSSEKKIEEIYDQPKTAFFQMTIVLPYPFHTNN